MTRVLVTCIGAPPGRNSVRALTKFPELEIFASDARDEALAELPFDVPKARMPLASSPDFVPLVKKYCLQNKIEVILPCLENEVEVFSKNKNVFEAAGIKIPVPDYGTLIRGLDKAALTEMARNAGLPFPKSVHLASDEDIKRISSLRYPVIAKPKIGYGAKGILIYEKEPVSWAGLKEVLRLGDCLVQEYIPGGAGSIHLAAFVYDRNHQIKLAYQSKSTKTKFAFGGPATAGVTVFEPQLRNYAERIMKEIGPWFGPVNMEFKRHSETGDFYIMDLNPRIWGYSSLAEDAGLPFPYASVLVALGRDFRSHEDYMLGTRMERVDGTDISTFDFGQENKVQVARGEARVAIFPDGMRMSPPEFGAFAEKNQLRYALVFGSSLPFVDKRLILWQPPRPISPNDLSYWAGHLLGASEVLVPSGDTWQNIQFSEIRRRWWSMASL